MKRTILCTFFISLLFCSPFAYADTLIVPSQRIDGAFITMDYYIIQKGWGLADETLKIEELTIFKNKRYLTIFYVQGDKLAMVETFSSQFKTESGIKVGSHRQDVVKAYGGPIDEETYTYTCLDGKQRNLYCQLYIGDGIGFTYDPETHKVLSIIVFPSGKYIKNVRQ